jgi:organic radical activating enzyme
MCNSTTWLSSWYATPFNASPSTLAKLSRSPASLLTLKHDNADRETFRWPTLEDALRWADAGKPVFLQPRNERTDIDPNNLRIVMDILAAHPNLRLSSQLHKILKVQ